MPRNFCLFLSIAIIWISGFAETNVVLLDGRTFNNATIRRIGNTAAVIETPNGKTIIQPDLLSEELQITLGFPVKPKIQELTSVFSEKLTQPKTAAEYFESSLIPLKAAAQKRETETDLEYRMRLSKLTTPEAAAIVVNFHRQISYNADKKSVIVSAGYKQSDWGDEFTISTEEKQLGDAEGYNRDALSVRIAQYYRSDFILRLRNWSGIRAVARVPVPYSDEPAVRWKIEAPLTPLEYEKFKESIQIVVLVSNARGSEIESKRYFRSPTHSSPINETRDEYVALVDVVELCLVNLASKKVLARTIIQRN